MAELRLGIDWRGDRAGDCWRRGYRDNLHNTPCCVKAGLSSALAHERYCRRFQECRELLGAELVNAGK